MRHPDCTSRNAPGTLRGIGEAGGIRHTQTGKTDVKKKSEFNSPFPITIYVLPAYHRTEPFDSSSSSDLLLDYRFGTSIILSKFPS